MNVLVKSLKLCMIREHFKVVLKIKFAEKLKPCVVLIVVIEDSEISNLINFRCLEVLIRLLQEMIISL